MMVIQERIIKDKNGNKFMKKFLLALFLLCLSAIIHANKCVDNIASKLFVYESGAVLMLKDCSLQDQDISPIIEFLKKQPTNSILQIEMNSNKISDDGFIQLIHFLASANLLKQDALMIIPNNQISDAGAAEFAKTNIFMRLDLSSNKVSDFGAMLLASNQTIKALSLGNSGITDAGVVSLAQNSNFSMLELQGNLITDAGAYKLARKNIGWLNVSNNKIGTNGIAALENAYKQHQYDYLFDQGNPGNS